MPILNALPGSVMNDSMDCGLIHAVAPAKFALGYTALRQLSNLSHLRLSHFAPGTLLTSQPDMSAFILAICAVILSCSKPKMIRIAATSIVTGVTYVKRIRNWTFREKVSQPMRADRAASVSCLAIAIFGQGKFPWPTLIRFSFLDIGPKPLLWTWLLIPPNLRAFFSAIHVRLVASHYRIVPVCL